MGKQLVFVSYSAQNHHPETRKKVLIRNKKMKTYNMQPPRNEDFLVT